MGFHFKMDGAIPDFTNFHTVGGGASLVTIAFEGCESTLSL